MIRNKRQNGVYSVEFSIVAAVFFILFFAVLEGARLMYTWNVLTEVSRRGARLATVCHVLRDSTDDESPNFKLINETDATSNKVLSVATFADDNLIPNLSPANINISYLDINGNAATTFSQIRLVRAEIKNYKHQLLIPFFSITLNSPSFSTTLPRESLGVTKDTYTTCNEI